MDSRILFDHSRALRASSLQLILEARAARRSACAAAARSRALLARLADAEAHRGRLAAVLAGRSK